MGTIQRDCALTEASVGDEVDRILKSINVNGFKHEEQQPASLPVSENHGMRTQPNGSSATPAEPADPQLPLSIPPVTSILADFITNAKTSMLTPEIREQLSECILDNLAVSAAGSKLAASSVPIFQGILAFSHSQALPPGKGCTVITQAQTYPPHIAALLNATYGHSLDFDDTHLESSLHAGVTAIATVLAESECQIRQNNSAVTSDEVLLAMLIGYEVTIRIGVALSTSAYSRGFHITPVAGIFGCVAALSILRKLEATVIINAFGLAGSKAAGSMQYLSNGSHNKRLHAGFAAHDAFLCVSLAQAGVIGADKIIEGDLGLLQGYTDRDRHDVDWEKLISDLGTKWEFYGSALKPYAGCRMTHGFVELADSLGKKLREQVWKDSGVGSDTVRAIKKIRCIMPKANMILVGQRLPNKIHPSNFVDAQFSAYYQVANAIVYGGTHDMAPYAPERLDDPQIRAICDKIECLVDESMKGMSCRMEAYLQNDDEEIVEIVKREVPEPLGERSNPFEREGVEQKFLGLMEQACGPQHRGRDIMRLVEDMTNAGGGIQPAKVVPLMDMLADTSKSRTVQT